MAHPIGKHISKEQDHELEHWLRSRKFRITKSNKEILIRLIDDAKIAVSKTSNQHLEHEELHSHFDDLTNNLSEYPFEQLPEQKEN